jgi:hypothetical protein
MEKVLPRSLIDLHGGVFCHRSDTITKYVGTECWGRRRLSDATCSSTSPREGLYDCWETIGARGPSDIVRQAWRDESAIDDMIREF